MHELRCPTACGIFSDLGSNPCLLPWQAEFLSLDHRGSSWEWLKTSWTCYQIQILKFLMSVTPATKLWYLLTNLPCVGHLHLSRLGQAQQSCEHFKYCVSWAPQSGVWHSSLPLSVGATTACLLGRVGSDHPEVTSFHTWTAAPAFCPAHPLCPMCLDKKQLWPLTESHTCTLYVPSHSPGLHLTFLQLLSNMGWGMPICVPETCNTTCSVSETLKIFSVLRKKKKKKSSFRVS